MKNKEKGYKYIDIKNNKLKLLGLANFVFTVKKLNDKMLLHISIIPPAENDSRFKK